MMLWLLSTPLLKGFPDLPPLQYDRGDVREGNDQSRVRGESKGGGTGNDGGGSINRQVAVSSKGTSGSVGRALIFSIRPIPKDP